MRYAPKIGLVLIIAFGVWFSATFFWIALSRVNFAYLVEWMEGGILQQAAFYLANGQVYPPPSAKHLPYIYPPLYTYVAAVLSKMFGPSLTVMRAFSLFCTSATAITLGLFCWRVRRSWLGAFVAATLYLASFQYSGFFMDIARLDALLVLLLVLAVYVHLGSSKRPLLFAVLAGVCYCVAAMCKQTAAVVAAIICLGAVFTGGDRKRDLVTLSVAGIGIVASYGLLFHFEPEAFWYLFNVPSAHAAPWSRVGTFLQVDILQKLAGRGQEMTLAL
jgi:4-amino-4-deoxy-L-arabinose transferase-like glycosyltransferase